MSIRSLIFSPEQVAFIQENYPRMGKRELTAALNAKFASEFGVNQVSAFVHNHKVQSGRTGRFVKGQQSWNKGRKGYMGPNRTSFRKGNVPANIRGLGEERIDKKDGYVLIKVPEKNPYTGAPTRFKAKHLVIWEEHNGPLPKGKVVIFRDGDIYNFDPDNLVAVTRGELLQLNRNKYREVDPILKPTVFAHSMLQAKISEVKRGRR